jgi:Carboxypeptidase regulatory-like domain/TonB-dependent Receptor Plug Domain
MRRSLLFCVIFTIFITNIFAQSEAGSAAIEGTITDQNSGAIAGANIIVKNTETNLSRTVTSRADGGFSVLVLPVGTYKITVKAANFSENNRENVTLTVGEATNLSIVLSPEGVKAEVEITSGDAENIDKEESSTGTAITQRSIENLPVRGRNFTEFVQLTPGVVQESDRKGLVIAGQRSINSNVAIDGADFNDALQGNQRGGNDATFFFPQTAIREFQVVRSGASAEVGRTGAGFVNAVTKSGTNDFRGEVFYFNRNDRLTSRDAFGNDGGNKQNQYGGSIGGPIYKDQAFFFVGVEQSRLEIPYFVDFFASPSVFPSSLTALEGEQISTNNPTAIFVRADFVLNQNNSLNYQFTHSRLKGSNFEALENGTVLTERAASRDFFREGSSNGGKLGLTSVFTPTFINEFRGQIASDNRNEEQNTSGAEIRIRESGRDIARIGGSSSRPRLFNTLRYQVSDTVSYDVGSHRLRFGVDVNFNKFKAKRQSDLQGVYRFESLADYNNGIPRRFEQSFVIIPEEITARGTQREYALFIQDKFKFGKNITATAGFRWEGLQNPQPPRPNAAFAETTKIPNDYKQYQPRLGLAWDIFGKGNSVLRLSGGLFTARTPSILFLRVFTNNNLVTQDVRIDERSGACRTAVSPTPIPTNCYFRGTGAFLTFPNALANLPTANFLRANRVFGFDKDFINPRSFQGSATWEQKIGKDYALTIGYTRTSAWNLQRRVDRNLSTAVLNATANYPTFPNARPNTAIGIFSVNESTAHSTYDALAVSLRRRFAQRFQIEANYTFANNRDDDSNERNFSAERTLNPQNLKLEAGPSKQDVRHNFNLSGVYDLGKGFSFSGIMVTRTGFPYTPIVGSDIQNDSNDDNDRAVINGQIAGRNSLRQPKFYNLDLRLMKSFNLGEKRRFDISADVFNTTRNTNKNYGVDSVSVFGNAGNSLPTQAVPTAFPFAGEPFAAPSTARFGGPRQLQIGAKFVF